MSEYYCLFLSSSEINKETDPYLDLGIYSLECGFLSFSVLQSTA